MPLVNVCSVAVSGKIYHGVEHVTHSIIITSSGLFEEEKKASEPIAAHKAKDYYKECMNTGNITVRATSTTITTTTTTTSTT